MKNTITLLLIVLWYFLLMGSMEKDNWEAVGFLVGVALVAGIWRLATFTRQWQKAKAKELNTPRNTYKSNRRKAK